ncbi:MAG: MarR family transcriptional regulator [Dehalococcoidia bacterium]|nr:MarR family transcriptional regulator [Dehalococcoidia bacterium]
MTEAARVAPPQSELLESVVRLVVRVSAALDPIRLQTWEEMGLTLAQLRILFRVRSQPGVDVRRIAADIGITPSAVSQQVDKLVTRGMLLRRDKPEDRRYVQLDLTEAGQESTGHIRQASWKHVSLLLAEFSDAELRDLQRLLTRFLGRKAGWSKQAEATPG